MMNMNVLLRDIIARIYDAFGSEESFRLAATCSGSNIGPARNLPDLLSETFPWASSETEDGSDADTWRVLVNLTIHLTSPEMESALDSLGIANLRIFFLEILLSSICDSLACYSPSSLAALHCLGLVEFIPIETSDAPDQPIGFRREIQLSNFSQITRPDTLFRRVYGWGTSFDSNKLSYRVGNLLQSLGISVMPLTTLAEAPDSDRLLRTVDFPEDALLVSIAEPGLRREEVHGDEESPATALSGVVGIILCGTRSSSPANDGLSIQLVAAEGLTIVSQPFFVEIDGSANFGLNVRPTGLEPVGALRSRVTLGVAWGTEAEPLRFGRATGTRLELAGIRASLGAAVGTDGVDVEIELEARSGKLVISSEGVDGFLRTIFPQDGVAIDFELGLGWSWQKGLHFKGGLSLNVERSLQLTIAGIISIDRLFLRFSANEQSVSASLALGFRFGLGPLAVRVDRIGVCALVGLSSALSGSAIGFDPPSGVGISISSGAVNGGGFISYEQTSGRYSGAMSLTIGEIALRAIGILDTHAPGVIGYSFLVAIAAEFTPVQLGMGFTLNGVGGLCGIQRSVALPALQAGVRAGSLTPLLFPRDPVGQASQLVTELQTIFPPANDRYVFGPMFKLGWGTPTIVTIDFGIILQLPAPISVALIGTINMIFPDQSVPTPIVAIHIDIAGSLDTGAKTLAIDASLRDSKIAGYDLTGDMALRLSWGDQPDFALSIGGFHKAFKPPQGFPELRRLSLGMVQSAFRLTCSAFLAVTSNTFQIGARAELYAEAAGFNVFGYVEFDALITFSPFSFRFDFAAGLALRRGTSVIMGISVAGMISGPNPWHVQGSASISLLFFEISVSFDKTFGDTAAEPLPETVNLWEKLQAAVQDLHNWIADPAPDAVRVVSCASPPSADGQPRLDPLGTLGFHQRVLPLARRVTKFGEKRVEAPTTLSLSTASVGEHEVHAPQTVQENFAASQFQQLSDADKLSRPSFEAMPAGAVLTLDALTVHAPTATDLAYQVIAIRQDQTRVLFDVMAVPSALDLTTSLVAVADQAPLRASAERRYAPPRAAVPLAMLEDDHVIVVDAATLRPASFRDQPTASPGEAHDAIAARLREHPDELGAWRVVPVQDARMDHAA